ncbi:hypothetical protein ADL21_11420 [Streptomyces albus subsp. albus]|nr:hypothetical protein ADL21_11420 [Streptomyces albus subsp. albus]
MPTTTRAIVLGCGAAGTLAAAALTGHVDEVMLLDRYPVPNGPGHRRGVPQARHTHVVSSRAAHAVEALLPGTTQRWIAAGARRIGMPSGLVALTAQGWMRRWPSPHFVVACSRDLLDWVVREQVVAHPAVTLRTGLQAVGLTGNARRVTGVQVRDGHTGQTTEWNADFVIDATGRGSQAPHWLARLGLPIVREETIDCGLAYATRCYRPPAGAGPEVPLVSITADPRSGRPGQGALLLPIEGNRWQVTLGGTRGGEPPTDTETFADFARGVRHPIVANLLATAEPLGPVHYSRSTSNRRRYFERLRPWPDGFVVLGDAVAAYNPVYGQGLTVAACGAVALDDALRDGGLAAGTAHAVQRAITRPVAGAWATAAGQDAFYPGATGPRPTAAARMLQRYMDRLIRTTATSPTVAEAFFDAITLSRPLTCLAAPKVAASTLRGPTRRPPSGPPFSSTERRCLGLLPPDRYDCA